MESSSIDLYNTSPAFLFSFSQENLEIKNVNEGFLHKLGYKPEELIGVKKLTDILTVGSKIFYQTHFAPLLKLHGKFNEIFLSFVSKSNEELPILMNALLDVESNEFHCGGIQIDQRNRFEKELQEAKKIAEKAISDNETLVHYREQLEGNQRLLETRLQELSQRNSEHQQINSVISHDLQEPLRKICIFSDKLLNEKEISIETTREQLSKINLAADKMRGLINHLQMFLSINDRHIIFSQVNLNEVVKRALIKNKISSVIPPVTLTIESLPEILGVEDLLISVFHELIDNSLKFSDPLKSNLQITIQFDTINQNIFKEQSERYEYAPFIRIIYSDNGIGFDNFLANEIFSLFRKAHLKEGLGIGLSYARRIIELHKGSISAKGVKGKGASFTLLFPSAVN